MNAAEALTALGRPTEALPLVEDALRLEPQMPIALFIRATVLVELGRLDEAAKVVRDLEPHAAQGRLPPEDLELARDGMVLARGNPTETKAALARRVAAARTLLGVLAWIARYGGPEVAVSVLSQQAKAGIVEPYDFLVLAPGLESIRRHPGCARILGPSRARFEEMLEILDEARGRGEFPSYLETPLAELRSRLQLPRATGAQ
jgi:hypothetical protein